MDVCLRCTPPHAARGEVYHQRSGPVGPAGAGVVGDTARANMMTLLVCARRCTRLVIASPLVQTPSLGNLIELRSIRKLGTFCTWVGLGTSQELGPVLLNLGPVLLYIRY